MGVSCRHEFWIDVVSLKVRLSDICIAQWLQTGADKVVDVDESTVVAFLCLLELVIMVAGEHG